MKKLITIIVCITVIQSISFSQTWDALANVPEDLTFPVVVTLNGEIHIIGGGGPGGATDLHLRYKPTLNVWDTLAPVPYLAQQPAGAALNGKIHYFGGGYPNSGTPLSSHFVYDPLANSWDTAAALLIPRVIMEAAAINGKIYAISGQPTKNRVDEYNPTTDSWIMKNPLPDNNFWYSATVVLNDEIYRFGGGGYTGPANSVHKYNSVNDSWSSIASLPKALHAPAGTSMGGKIYITGGYNSGNLDEAYIFDASTLTFNKINPLPGARSYHEMATVDSCIYSIGGNNPAVPGVGVSLLRNCHPNNVSIKEILSEKSINIFPNPASDYTIVNIFSQSNKTLNLKIINLLGETIYESEIECSEGENSFEIPLDDFKSGIFLCIINSKDFTKSQKLIIEK